MSKLIHTNSSIFFSNPYVLRLDFPDKTYDTALREYLKNNRKAYRLMGGTWGHTTLEMEMVRFKHDHETLNAPGPGFFGAMLTPAVISSLLDPDFKQIPRGYLCFADELDALQYRLTVEANAIHVLMWPTDRKFTIHEVVETDDT